MAADQHGGRDLSELCRDIERRFSPKLANGIDDARAEGLHRDDLGVPRLAWCIAWIHDEYGITFDELCGGALAWSVCCEKQFERGWQHPDWRNGYDWHPERLSRVVLLQRADKTSWEWLQAHVSSVARILQSRHSELLQKVALTAEDVAIEGFVEFRRTYWRADAVTRFKGLAVLTTVIADVSVNVLRKKWYLLNRERNAIEGREREGAADRGPTLGLLQRIKSIGPLPAELRDAVDHCMARLKPKEREALYYREVLGLDYAEVGRRIGVRKGTAQNLVCKGRRSFVSQLARLLSPEDAATGGPTNGDV